MSPEKQILTRAVDLTHRYGLSRQQYAKDIHGETVAITSANAACFCTAGFIDRAAIELKFPHDVGMSARTPVNILVPDNIPNWNDEPGRTIEEVRDLLTKARDSIQ